MMNLDGPLEYGLLGMALLAVLGLIDFIRKKIRETPNGDRRQSPIVIECPNKIPGIAATLRANTDSTNALRVLIIEQVKLLQHVANGTDRLVDQHKPNPNGRETWKGSAAAEKVQEESRDLLKQMVFLIEQNVLGK